jgi:hypothetical protein
VTVLIASQLTTAAKSGRRERCHGRVLGGRVLARILASENDVGAWTANTQLYDMAFHPAGDAWQGGPFATHGAAYQAGLHAAARLHAALINVRDHAQKKDARFGKSSECNAVQVQPCQAVAALLATV